jgi:hypothetical protein
MGHGVSPGGIVRLIAKTGAGGVIAAWRAQGVIGAVM